MKKVLLIDTRLWLYMHYHRKENILNIFEALSLIPCKDFNRIYFCFDYGKSYYHKSLYPDYKENRTEKREAMSEEEKNRYKIFSQQYKDIQKLTSYFGVNIALENAEADTVIEVLADKFLKLDYEVWVASNDGDFMCLLDRPNLLQVTTRYEVINEQGVIKKKGATPKQLFIAKCLSGDTKDNIIGISGLGEIKDSKSGAILKKIFTEFGDYDEDVIRVLQDRVNSGKLKLPENYPKEKPVTSVRELYEFNRKLNAPFTYNMLTKEHQESLSTQVNTKKVVFNQDEFDEECFRLFGTMIYLQPSIKYFYNLKES